MPVKAETDIESLKKDIEQLKADLKAAAGDSSDVVQSAREQLEAEAARLIKKLQGQAGKAAGNVSDAAQAVASNMRHAADSALEQGGEFVQSVEGKVADKPLQSLLMAFGVGLLAGWLIRRK